MFLYLFLLLFSGLCPSSLLFFTFASIFCRAYNEQHMELKLTLTVSFLQYAYYC